MNKSIHTLLFTGLFSCLAVTSYAESETFECGGSVSKVYATPDTSISICHAPYTSFDLSALGDWQPCVDAIMYITAKNGVTTIHTDCTPDTYNEFKVAGNSLFIKHYYEAYPDFEHKPLVVDEFAIQTHKSTYTLVADFAAITKQQLDKSLSGLESELRRSFDGTTYFTAVYGAFNDLLAYATQDPGYALKVLAEYEQRGVFDGEVSETLGSTIAAAELIQKAIQPVGRNN